MKRIYFLFPGAWLLSLSLFLPMPLAAQMAESTMGSTELPDNLERHTFDLNAYRTSHDLPPLSWNREMAEIARGHSRDMAMGAVDFGHDGFNDRMKKLKEIFPGLHGGGENVFESDGRSGLAEFAVASWLKSAPHLHNIRGDYDYSGLGLWRNDKGVFFFTQIFIKAGGQ